MGAELAAESCIVQDIHAVTAEPLVCKSTRGKASVHHAKIKSCDLRKQFSRSPMRSNRDIRARPVKGDGKAAGVQLAKVDQLQERMRLAAIG
jgi:hypothetical protein